MTARTASCFLGRGDAGHAGDDRAPGEVEDDWRAVRTPLPSFHEV